AYGRWNAVEEIPVSLVAAQQQRGVGVRIADVSQPAVSLLLTHDRERVIGAEEACGRKIGILRREIAQIENALDALAVDVDREWRRSDRLSDAARVIAQRQVESKGVAQVEIEIGDQIHEVINIAARMRGVKGLSRPDSVNHHTGREEFTDSRGKDGRRWRIQIDESREV